MYLLNGFEIILMLIFQVFSFPVIQFDRSLNKEDIHTENILSTAVNVHNSQNIRNVQTFLVNGYISLVFLVVYILKTTNKKIAEKKRRKNIKTPCSNKREVLNV